MIHLRKKSERGITQIEWLKSYHTFSFGNYYDANHSRFRSLRVMNEDIIAPKSGFGMHPHRDMEIITYVLEGNLQHQDSLGNQSIIHSGEFQRMSAGSGIEHSEWNPSERESVHLIQIWIVPGRKIIEPGYEQKTFEQKPSSIIPIATPDGQNGTLVIHQTATLSRGRLSNGHSLSYSPSLPHVWIQVTQGELIVNACLLNEGDGAAVTQETTLTLDARKDTEFLLFELK